MSTFGERLKEERKRLGLTQAELAAKTGIHRNTQNRYEKGEREPDTTYLDALHEIGINVLYLLDRTVPDWAKESMDEALSSFKEPQDTGWLFLASLGISTQEWGRIVDRVVKRSYNGAPFFDGNDPRWGDEIIKASKRISALLESASTLDSDLLASVVDGVEVALLETGKAMAPAQKGRVVAMLYRAFKVAGHFDPTLIEQTVTLAS